MSGMLWLLLCIHPMFPGATGRTMWRHSFFFPNVLNFFFFLICSTYGFWNGFKSFLPHWINTCGFVTELQLCLFPTQSLRAPQPMDHPWPLCSSQCRSASKVPKPPGFFVGQRHVAAVMFPFKRRGLQGEISCRPGPC